MLAKHVFFPLSTPDAALLMLFYIVTLESRKLYRNTKVKVFLTEK